MNKQWEYGHSRCWIATGWFHWPRCSQTCQTSGNCFREADMCYSPPLALLLLPFWSWISPMLILFHSIGKGGPSSLKIGNVIIPAPIIALSPSTSVFPQLTITRGVLTCCNKAILREDVSHDQNVSHNKFSFIAINLFFSLFCSTPSSPAVTRKTNMKCL